MYKCAIRWLCTIALVASAGAARASFHLWQIDEIYSNADGTAQFIELSTGASGQEFLAGHTITSLQGSTSRSFTFPSDLPGDSAGSSFLIATTGFAALGLVTPDYIVPNGFLFTTNGSINFAGVDVVSWTALPIDGVKSIDRFNALAISSPTNFAGQTATIATLNLVAGWNLVGNSSGVALSVSNSFGDAAKVASVWKWLASTLKWAFYSPSSADGGAAFAAAKGYDLLTTLNAGEGFWVNANVPSTAQLPPGTAVASASFQTMPSGWNLIAIGDNKTPGEFTALASSATPLASVWAWDAVKSNWYFYASSLDDAGTLPSYISSRGYLDFGANTLNPTTGFWANKP